MENCFVISLTSLQQGSHSQKWEASEKFFEEFGSNEIRRADIVIELDAVKVAGLVKATLRMKGNVVVPCDRCLEDLEIPVDTTAELVAGAGAKDLSQAEEIEITDGELVFDQIVYDYVLTSLPLVKTHEEGKCSAAALKALSHESEEKPAGSNPFEGLKDLLK